MVKIGNTYYRTYKTSYGKRKYVEMSADEIRDEWVNRVSLVVLPVLFCVGLVLCAGIKF